MSWKQPTQSDVAKLAKVSPSTVSLVLNGKDAGRIPEHTRQRVLEAINKLGYGPNIAARMLVKQSNHLIGVFTYERYFPYETDNFFYPFVLGIERQASREGYNLVLFTRNDGQRSRGIYRDQGNLLSMVDGAVLMGIKPDENEIRKLVSQSRPFVFIGRREIPGCDFDWVASDYKSASYDITSYLIELGHRNIGFVGAEGQQAYFRDRIDGCRQAVDEAEHVTLKVLPPDMVRDERELYQFIVASQLTALVCGSNVIMARVYRQLEKLGLKVPDDISLSSLTDDHADFPWEMQHTGIRLNRPRVGEEAIKLLVARLKGLTTEPQHLLVPCEIVIGETTQRISQLPGVVQ